MTRSSLLVLLFLCSIAITFCASTLQIDVDDTTGAYTLMVDGKQWLQGAGAAFHSAGKWYKTSDGSLKLQKIEKGSGKDKLGSYASTTMYWMGGSEPYITEFQQYHDSEVIKCVQSLPNGAKQTSSGDSNDVMMSFPTFDAKTSFNYFTYKDTFAYAHIGQFSSPGDIGNMNGGPVMIYDNSLRNVIFSPLDNFMIGGSTISKQLDGVFANGPMGSVNSIPTGFSYTTVIVGGQSVNSNFYNWGSVLLTQYDKKRIQDDADVLIQYLGYWTDNGAYYYYVTEPDKNYEDTMIDVYNYITQLKVPVKSYQFDSWWYFKGNGGGVTLWEPTPAIFPNGMKYLDQKMGNMPLALHNRYFATNTEYTKNFTFVCEKKTCLPTGEDLYLYIMGKAKEWGMVLYEQDWLVTSYTDMATTQNNTYFARNWMMNMGKAAEKLGLTIQYCMPLPRHLLQSVELQSVTQARASGDYNPGNRNWDVGPTSMLHWAIGIKPFKDDFWTGPSQPGCKYGKGCKEPNTEMITNVAAMTGGPVGPSDKIGSMNKDLVMRTCNADGLLLKPDKPMTTMDKVFKDNFSSPKIENLWSTFSKHGSMTWSYAIGIDLSADEMVYPEDLDLSDASYFAYDFWAGTVAGFNKTSPLKFPQQSSGTAKDFKYYVVSNMKPSNAEIVLIGEIDKFASMASQRFTSVGYSGSNLEGQMTGVPGEVVNLGAVSKGALLKFSCTLGKDGKGSFTCSEASCKC